RESARKWINGQSIPETARLKTLIGWLNLDAAFIYSTTIIEKANIPLGIDSEQDRAKVEAYGLRKMEGLAQAAYTVVNFHSKLLNSEFNRLETIL
ncbi:MAG: hypothetical protein HQ457_06385, partial [Betaproteobacteria bacterium]|nr:hypothetical protein [Betaproteobacteria bacterium]